MNPSWQLQEAKNRFSEVVEEALTHGPQTVTRQILDFYDQVGGFGTILFHAGRPYATPEKLVRSMELFMREVAPKLRQLDPDAQAPAVAAE